MCLYAIQIDFYLRFFTEDIKLRVQIAICNFSSYLQKTYSTVYALEAIIESVDGQ